MAIREAVSTDSAALAELSAQLGYPVPGDEMAIRLAALLADPHHGVFVFDSETGRVLGWIHVFRSLYLEASPMAEIGGLVVDEASRGRGIGARLVERVERWALAHGLTRIRVRSRLERTDAHRFYDRLGYGLLKRQQVFVKELVPPA
jgi:GNAT superfamily N-acetyltransferase